MEDRLALIEVAAKKRAAQMVIIGGKIVNVYSGEIIDGNIGIYGKHIAYVGEKEVIVDESTKTINATGFYLVPGYIEPHSHLWVCVNPIDWAKKLLIHGTTTVFSDSYNFFIHQGKDGFSKMINDLLEFPFHFNWNLSLTYITPVHDENRMLNQAEGMWNLGRVSGISEIIGWPKILEGNQKILSAIKQSHEVRKVVEVHSAGASYEKLNGIVAAGVDGDHEAINMKQALERLRLGLWTMLRHNSSRRDLPVWASLLNRNDLYSDRMMLTTDGPSPMFVDEHGAMDYLLSQLVEEGVDPMKALRLVTLNPATFYRMDGEIGGIAPGRRADILFLRNLQTFRPERVVLAGRLMVEKARIVEDWPTPNWASWGAKSLVKGEWPSRKEWYRMPSRKRSSQGYPVIDLVDALITRPCWMELPEQDGKVDVSGVEDVHHVTLLDRRGSWATQGLIKGFARHIDGYACSVSLNENILVIGKHESAMAMAAQRVIDLGGGIALVDDNKVIHEVPLRISGIMSDLPFNEIADLVNKMEQLLRERGHQHNDFLLTSLFLPANHIPDWRITELGLLDVKTGNYIYSSD